MIFLIYRRFDGPLIGYDPGKGWTGSAYLYLPYDLTFDGVTIKSGFPGSGIQQRGGYNGETYSLYQAAHELCHYEFGSGHIPGNSNLSIMNGGPAWNASRGMHPWERVKLDWIDYQDKSSDEIIDVADFYTTDIVYRIPVSTTEYFLIVNHQDISPHDWAQDKGIYIHHVSNADYFPPLINVECADGNWEFSVDVSNQKIIRGRSNRLTEEDELNFYRSINQVGYFCRTPFYPADDAWGDLFDAFDLIFNNVFSPKSNPYSANGASLNFTAEVVQKLPSNTYKVQLYFSNPYAGKPSKPQNLEVEQSLTNHPYLTWDANQEPDILRYNIWKKEFYSGSWHWDMITTTTQIYFEDITETFCSNPPQYCGDPDPIYYGIQAVDNQRLVSVKSDSVVAIINGGGGGEDKIGVINNLNVPVEYLLDQNYPNPFNPVTTISYSIKVGGIVTLKVFDILGKESTTLVNEMKEPGNYTVTFNASELSSGIYFYTLTSGNFTSTKKLILLK